MVRWSCISRVVEILSGRTVTNMCYIPLLRRGSRDRLTTEEWCASRITTPPGDDQTYAGILLFAGEAFETARQVLTFIEVISLLRS